MTARSGRDKHSLDLVLWRLSVAAIDARRSSRAAKVGCSSSASLESKHASCLQGTALMINDHAIGVF
jgi:hypothetical protein